MKRSVKIGLVGGLIALSFAAWRMYFSPIENAVELRLNLAKNEWETGEFLWYKLEIKNVSRRRIEFFDRAWFNSGALATNSTPRPNEFNSTLTRLIVTDPAGNPVYPMNAPFGYHGERKMWTDDCGAQDCGGLGSVSLAAGQSLTSAPSKAAPIRYKRNGLADPGDVRIPPGYESQEPPHTDSPKHREWRKLVESIWRDGTAQLGPRPESVRTVPLPGYTILDRYNFAAPGRYEMKIVLAACGGDIKNAAEAHARFKEQHNRLIDCRAWFKASRNLYFTSNTVTFTVVPAKQSVLRPRESIPEAVRRLNKQQDAAFERALKNGGTPTPRR